MKPIKEKLERERAAHEKAKEEIAMLREALEGIEGITLNSTSNDEKGT